MLALDTLRALAINVSVNLVVSRGQVNSRDEVMVECLAQLVMPWVGEDIVQLSIEAGTVALFWSVEEMRLP